MRHGCGLIAAGILVLTVACGGSGGDGSGGAGGGTASSSSGAGAAPSCPTDTDPVLPSPPRHTARWAFEPWISKDISDTDDTRAFVKGFRDRDIPVGVVVLDSPWETNYNTFVPNPERYHGFAALVDELHGEDIRLVLWITAFLNRSSYDLEMGGDTYPSPAPGFEEAIDCGFFVEDGTNFGWWKGIGGSIDFFDGRARAFWHRTQDPLYDTGIDGFKLDFGDSYVTADPVKTAAGEVPHQRYSEAYYQDFLAYGTKRRGRDFVTMTRAWDASYTFAGRFFAKKEDSPVSWMGDNRRDFVGLADALDETFRSARAGYTVLGSDIGGYLDRDDVHLTETIPFDTTVFARWTAIGALSPFMELHGRANITPWTVPDHVAEVVSLYRYWAKLHHELVPFYYSLTEEADHGAPVPVQPIGDEASWAGDYRYRLGDALLVAPILTASGTRDVALPAGDAWYDWWNPAGDAIAGGQTLAGVDATDLAKVPLYVRRGAIVPLAVDDAATGLGDAASAGKLTVLVYPDATASSFALHDTDDAVTKLGAAATASSATVTLSRTIAPTLLRVRDDVGFTSVTVDGAAAPAWTTQADFDANATGFFADASTRSVWVHVPKGGGAHTVTLAAP
ncbi:MAG TPA: TIM-barrel domain-containing protein [Minicystis sp.]|nr:TIM-barrel domain-containing protein [Minicystis sp.]